MNDSRTVLSVGQAMELNAVLGHTIGQAHISGDRAVELIKTKTIWQPQVIEILRGTSKPAGNWLDAIIARQKEVFGDLAGQAELDFFAATLEDPRFGQEKVVVWQRLKLEPFCLSRQIFDDEFLAGKAPMSQFYHEQVVAKNIMRIGADGQLVPVGNVGLDGIVALVDTRKKPAYRNGGQMYAEDSKFLGQVIKSLRRSKEIEDFKPQTSRFCVSAEEWQDKTKPALAERSEFEGIDWRLETYPEFWCLGQTLRPGDGDTDTWIWFEENFEDASARLFGGNSDDGGLAYVNYYDAGNHWSHRAVRPLGVVATLPLGS